MKKLALLLGMGMYVLVPCATYASPKPRLYNYEEDLPARKITGTVLNADGQPVEGATILVKGTTLSTVTDSKGAFEITVNDDNAFLVISYVGFETQEISVNGKTSIQLTLKATDLKDLDDVVVVGYGTQKRKNVTGSISTVNGDVLRTRPAPNSTNLLQGRVAGLQITQVSAEPGRDNAQILLRGRGSFAGGTNNSPLVLIDGVTGDLNTLAPDDIDDITVLKDAASASIYGARAANGVILVTTKKGKSGKAQFTASANVSQHRATNRPNLISNSAEYMEMYNEATKRSNGVTFKYAQSEIDKYKAANGSPDYPNFDSYDYYVKPATIFNGNIGISGGTDKSNYNISFSYLDQDALLPVYNFKRYNLLARYSNNITKNITFGTMINGTVRNRFEPPFTGENMMLAIYAAGPLYGPFLPDGSGRVVSRAYAAEGRNRNPQEMFIMGNQRTMDYDLNAQASLDVKFSKNLTWNNKIAVRYTDQYYKMHQSPYQAYLLQEKAPSGDYAMNSFGPDILGITEQYSKTLTPTFYSTLNYNTKIGDAHEISALAGYEQITYSQRGLRARRINGVNYNIPELNGYSNTGETINTTHPRLPGLVAPGEWGLQSFFARLNYNYDGKYFLEASIRRDGTSKVSPDYRWGYYPSVSAGWMINKEKFMDNIDWITTLKLRGSFGTLGNQDVGNYLYQENLVSSGVLYSFDNNTASQGVINLTFRDQSLRWESSQITDFGFDLDIKRGLLTVAFDWFNKKTYDVLAPQTIPSSLGLAQPTTNDGSMQNRGIEVDIRHRNQIGEFSYGAFVNFSTVRNKLLSIRTENITGRNIRKVGLPYESYFVYLVDGVVQTGETPMSHSLNANIGAGDIKMKDVNGDGKITPDDRVLVNGVFPDYNYSFGFDVQYKRLGLNVFFQGVQGLKIRVANWGVDPFQQGTPPSVDWRNAWSPTNPSNTMPALYISGYQHMAQYGVNSDFFLRDASYLRLKNISLSYALAGAFLNKMKVQSATVFVSADNLVTFTKFINGDPERPNLSTGVNSATNNLSQYPQIKIFNAGLNIKF
ncbi:SusC/RagA family TonB-linked outer membrane protein [Polluticaenibacter yanchengensis]|uniref:TonB-dependent receptor n=1 Tax=Polluticaenibacter yanchengensis TaxID=3014562 RepID=A0ABT4UKX8_9BACT|nr:TonB-dependent receptor [Chitinophagaceae bacterium LY-5]